MTPYSRNGHGICSEIIPLNEKIKPENDFFTFSD